MDERTHPLPRVEPSSPPKARKGRRVRTKLRIEETANQATHGLGAVLGVLGLVVLLVRARGFSDPLHTLSYAAFGVSLVLLYAASLAYHSVVGEKLKRRFKVLDHCAIYLLIAGTYTPFMAINLRGEWGSTMLTVIWVLAFVGIGFKLFFAHRFRIFSTIVYLVMGWLVVLVMGPLVKVLPAESLRWLVAGGVLYSLGVVFYLWDGMKFNHAVWHLFVLAGSVCHFVSVMTSAPV